MGKTSENIKTVWIDQDIHAEIKRLASATGRSIRTTLEIALIKGIEHIKREIKAGNILTNEKSFGEDLNGNHVDE